MISPFEVFINQPLTAGVCFSSLVGGVNWPFEYLLIKALTAVLASADEVRNPKARNAKANLVCLILLQNVEVLSHLPEGAAPTVG